MRRSEVTRSVKLSGRCVIEVYKGQLALWNVRDSLHCSCNRSNHLSELIHLGNHSQFTLTTPTTIQHGLSQRGHHTIPLPHNPTRERPKRHHQLHGNKLSRGFLRFPYRTQSTSRYRLHRRLPLRLATGDRVTIPISRGPIHSLPCQRIRRRIRTLLVSSFSEALSL